MSVSCRWADLTPETGPVEMLELDWFVLALLDDPLYDQLSDLRV